MNVELNYEYLTRCPLCKREHTQRPISRHSTSKIQIKDLGNLKYQFMICTYCGLIFQNPRFDKESTERYYKEVYLQFIQKEGGIRHLNPFVSTIARARVQAPLIAEYIPTINYHLDYGCQMDQLMREVQEFYDNDIYGWGIELDPTFREAAINVGAAVVERLEHIPPHLKGKFDLITLSHSLEHLNHPIDLLLELRDWGADDTHLMVEVPNAHWTGALQLSHPFAYTKQTLKEILRLTGWEIIHFESHGRPNLRFSWPFLTAIARKGDLVGWHVKRNICAIPTLTIKFNLSKFMKNVLYDRWFHNRLGQYMFTFPTHSGYVRAELIQDFGDSREALFRRSPTPQSQELYSAGNPLDP